MLTEQFIASVGPLTKTPGPGTPKDAAIFIHEFQPLSQQRQILKKSATPPNCLAVSATHVFAAQSDKGVVHVYNREKGNQEATVPFTEKISSIALACEDSVLALGTVEGRVFLWETATGRQVTTNQAHLQAVTALTIDPTGCFLLSASKDSTVNVWSIPTLLSFSSAGQISPLTTFSAHRSEATALLVGHSSSQCNFAFSASKDRTALIWDYRTGNVLRTYLLPGVPLSAAFDPADRAVYIGYEDGTLQILDLFASPGGNLDALQNGVNVNEPIQPPASTRWKLPDSSHGAVHSLSVSFDGTIVVSGHQSGSVLSWDVARGSFASVLTQTPLPGSVTNLLFLPVTSFLEKQQGKKMKVAEVIKPKFGAFDSGDSSAVPGNYALRVQFTSDLVANESISDFQRALTASSFPIDLLDEGLSELATWGKSGAVQANGHAEADEDYMALDDTAGESGAPSLQQENASLKQQLEALRRVQKKTFEKMDRLSEEKKALQQRNRQRSGKSSGKKQNGTIPGAEEDEDLSD